MKKLLIIFLSLGIFFQSHTFSVCIQGSGECNDTIDPQKVLSDEDIKLLINLGTIEITKQEIERFGLEQIKAYYWALNNGITTQPTINQANLGGKITREEMAKMISNYAINILGMTPDTTKSCFFINSNINPTLVQSVTESCQLGLMGQGISDFRPKDSVTRAEFGTVLSRALRGDKNEGGSTYYEKHLKGLKSEGIMNNINNPMDKEVRGYVMLMLMRSIDDTTKTQEKFYTDNQISDIIKMLD